MSRVEARGVTGKAALSWQAQQPVFWVLAALILICLLWQVGALFGGSATPTVIGMGLLLATVQFALLWAVVALITRSRVIASRDIDRGLSIVAVAWGMTVVPVIAAQANTQFFAILRRLGLHSVAASIAAPINEDLLRLAGTFGVLTLIAACRPLTPLDGLRVGFLVGAGLEVAENAAYAFGSSGAGEVGAQIVNAIHIMLVRSGVGFGLHALWTGIVGAALAYCLARRQSGLAGRWWVLAAATFVTMLLHSLWDAPALSIRPEPQLALLGGVYLATLALFTIAALLAVRAAKVVPSYEPAQLSHVAAQHEES